MSGFQPHGAAGGSGGQVRVPPFLYLVDMRLVATVDDARPPSHPRARDPPQIRSIVSPLSNRRARPLTSPLALLFLCPRAAG